MALFHLTNFSLSVGAMPLFDSVTLQLVAGQRVALAGANSSGKSTLLRVLASSDTLPTYVSVSSGQLRRPPGAAERVLLVEQDSLQWSRLLGGGSEEELRALTLPEALVLDATDRSVEDAEAWRRLSVATHDLLEWSVAGYESVALGNLSPGSSVRAYLAVALQRADVDVLLLDEPTNHLDLPSIVWLQKSIQASRKTVVMVSHDAAFMDAVCTHLWVIDPIRKSITVSNAKYTAFRRAEQLAREQQEAAYEMQQQRNKRLTAAADKLRDASTAGTHYTRNDQDKLYMQRLRDRAGRSGRKAAALTTLRDSQPVVERPVKHTPLHIEIQPLGAGSSSEIILESVVLGYDGVPLKLPPISLRIDFGEHIAIVGFNGCGKSTLLRTMTGVLPPISGNVVVGRELRIGNLMQEHENLPRSQSLCDHYSALVGLPILETRAKLIRNGLTLQQVESPICELNPGARARALLAGFSMLNVNVLVLDEPSNHLDEEAAAEILASLGVFEGTAIIVSHNRDFLAALRLDRMLSLSSDGLQQVDSLEAFVGEVEDAAERVVASTQQLH